MTAKFASKKKPPQTRTMGQLKSKGLIRRSVDYPVALYDQLYSHATRISQGKRTSVKTLMEILAENLCQHPQQNEIIDAILNQKPISYGKDA